MGPDARAGVTATEAVRTPPWPLGDPWASYSALHERLGPVSFDPDLDAWLVLGHAEASQVLRGNGWSSDPSVAASFAAVADSMGIDSAAFSRLFIFTDPPEHSRVRQAVQPPFGPGPVADLRERVRAITTAAVAGLDVGEEVDLMDRLARPVPLAVIGELFDLPVDAVGVLADESPALVRMLEVESSRTDLAAAAGAFTGLLIELLPIAAERRARPGHDVLSWIATDDSLELEEVVFAALLLAIAGHETTANLVGTTVARSLGEHAADASWTTEAVRLHTPVQSVLRVATDRQQVGDVEVAAGEAVVVAIAAANRDPAVYDRAESFLVGRGPAPLSFGLGRHYCVGARLAVLELAEIVRAIRRRGPVEIGDVEWNSSRSICGPSTLPLRFLPR